MSFNKLTLLGHLGRDPELRYTPQGTPVCTFPLATNERRKNESGDVQDIATWFRVVLWGRLAETASQYLSKGRPVFVEGRLRVNEWKDRDGELHHTLEVHGNEMQFVDSYSAGAMQSSSASTLPPPHDAALPLEPVLGGQ